eukprot:16448904-Heterocapsa_arctica.AAC.1
MQRCGQKDGLSPGNPHGTALRPASALSLRPRWPRHGGSDRLLEGAHGVHKVPGPLMHGSGRIKGVLRIIVVGPMRELGRRISHRVGHLDPHSELEVEKQLNGGAVLTGKPLQGREIFTHDGVQVVVNEDRVLPLISVKNFTKTRGGQS